MPPSDGERLATIEQLLRDRDDNFRDLRDEDNRQRQRLHKLEGSVGLLLDAQKQARVAENAQYRRLEQRLQILTFVLGIAALSEPFLYHLANGG